MRPYTVSDSEWMAKLQLIGLYIKRKCGMHGCSEGTNA